MTPAGNRLRRQIGAYGTDDRRFARMLVVSLVIHGVLAWLLLYHLEQFIPAHPPSAYLVELLTSVETAPVPQLPLAEDVPLLQAPEPAPAKVEVAPPEPEPLPVVVEPPPQKIPVKPPSPPPVVMTKTQPELTPPQSLQRKVQPSPTTSPQLDEAVLTRTAAPRDVELATPRMTRQQVPRQENAAALPESQSLPSARRNREVVARAAPNYQPLRQPSKEALPEQGSGLIPTTSNRGDITVPDALPRRTEPRSSRSEPSLPVDRGQPLAARSNTSTIASPRGPTSAPTKVSRAGNNETLPGTSPSGFTPPANRNAAIPLPETTGPAIAARPAAVGAGTQMPTDQTPRLQAASPQTKLDQTSLAAFRSLKTCLDTEQESRLKTRLAVLLEGDATCASGGSRYFFAATETAYSLQVGIATGAGQVFKDRCDALQQAVRCVEQSRK